MGLFCFDILPEKGLYLAGLTSQLTRHRLARAREKISSTTFPPTVTKVQIDADYLAAFAAQSQQAESQGRERAELIMRSIHARQRSHQDF
jgi:hypothetical protein